jgi:hypothetical protein
LNLKKIAVQTKKDEINQNYLYSDQTLSLVEAPVLAP